LDAWGELSGFLLPIAVIVPLTTIVVMASAGLVTQYILRKDKGKQQ
jgi:holin-like protein